MGKFDIDYASQLPPAEGPQVYGTPNVSTGSEMVARAIGNLGAIFSKIQEASDATQLSTMKREYDELSFERLNAYSQTGDPEVRANIVKDWDKGKDNIAAKSNNATIGRAFLEYRNDVEPQWAERFADTEMGIKKRNTLAAAQVNLDAAYERGDMVGLTKVVDDLVSGALMAPADRDKLLAEGPDTMIYVQAKRDFDMGRYNDAQQKLSNLIGSGRLQGDRLDAAARLLRGIKSGSADAGDVFAKQILQEAIQAEDLDPLQRDVKLEDMKKRLTDPNNPMSAEQVRVTINWIDSLLKPGDANVVTDWSAYEQVWPLQYEVANAPDGKAFENAMKAYDKVAPKLADVERKAVFNALVGAENDRNTKKPTSLKNPALVRAIGTLSNFYTNRRLDPTEEELQKLISEDRFRTYEKWDEKTQVDYLHSWGAYKELQIANQLEEYVKNNPDATDAEIAAKLEEHLMPVKTEAAKKWFSDWFWMRTPAFSDRFWPWPNREKEAVGPVKVKLSPDDPKHVDILRWYLQRTHDDRQKAMEMAAEDGYEW